MFVILSFFSQLYFKHEAIWKILLPGIWLRVDWCIDFKASEDRSASFFMTVEANGSRKTEIKSKPVQTQPNSIYDSELYVSTYFRLSSA
jgi:hypothetical protein